MLKRKAFNAINVLGLMAAMIVFLLVSQYVIYERGYDTDRKDLYRVFLTRTPTGQATTRHAMTFGALGTHLKEDIPGVKATLRLAPKFGNPIFSYQTTHVAIPNWMFAEAQIFPLMNVLLTKGDPTTALKRPYTIVISQRLATQFFGTSNPIGKIIRLGDLRVRREFEVTGVLAPRTGQSHLQFDALLSFATIAKFMFAGVDQDWNWDNFYTYVQLDPSASPAQVEQKMSGVLAVHKGVDLQKQGMQEGLRLQSVPDIHLHSQLQGEAGENGNARLTTMLLLVAGLVLLLAWLNYLNLTTATYNERAREIGVRKVVGAGPLNLVGQFLLETFLVFGISCLLALGLAEALLGVFALIMNKPLPSLLWSTANRWDVVLGFVSVGTLLAGLYPAFVLSSFNPVSILKSSTHSLSTGGRFRQTLVVFQFAVSILFVIGTCVVYRQLEFLRNKDIGIQSDGLLVINAPSTQESDSTYQQGVAFFKERAQRRLSISSVAASQSVPGKEMNLVDWRKESDDSKQAVRFRVNHIDADYAPTYELSFLAGKNFAPPATGTYRAVLLNEVALRQLGYSKPKDIINERLHFNGELYTVAGVVRNFHYASLRELIEPLAMVYAPRTQAYFSVRISGSNLPATLTHLQTMFTEAFPGNPFSYTFLDESLQGQYKAEIRFGQLIGALSVLAILIACMGLFGLTAYSFSKRTKEIGMRKVLGASVSSIVLLLSQDFLKLVVISIVIASPLAWYAMDWWLQDFAYKVGIDWWLFLLAGGLAVGISLLTVSFQSLKAALMNPVKSLRTE